MSNLRNSFQTYKNVPLEMIIDINHENSLSLIHIVLKKYSIEDYIQRYCLSFVNGTNSRDVYEIIDLFLFSYKSFDESDVHLIEPQKSGTCSIQILKSILFKLIKNSKEYEELTLEIHSESLKTAYYLFSKEAALQNDYEKVKILKKCVQNYIDQLYLSFSNLKPNVEPKPIMISALAVAVDIKNKAEKFNPQRLISPTVPSFEFTLVKPFEMSILNQFKERFEKLNSFSENSTNYTVEDILVFPILTGSCESLYDDLKIIIDFMDLLKSSKKNIGRKNQIQLTEWIKNYFFSFPMPNYWKSQILSPSKALELIYKLQKNKILNYLNSEVKFPLNIKIYAIFLGILKQLHADIFDLFPMTDFGFGKNDPIIGLNINDPEIIQQMQDFKTWFNQINKCKTNYDKGLFSSLIDLNRTINKEYTNFENSPDSTFDFYNYIMNQDYEFKRSAIELFKKTYPELHPYPVYYTTLLFCDFDDEDLLLSTKYRDWCFLRKIVLYIFETHLFSESGSKILFHFSTENLSFNSKTKKLYLSRLPKNVNLEEVKQENYENSLDLLTRKIIYPELAKNTIINNNYSSVEKEHLTLVDSEKIVDNLFEGLFEEAKSEIKNIISKIITLYSFPETMLEELLILFSFPRNTELLLSHRCLMDIFLNILTGSKKDDPFGNNFFKKIETDSFQELYHNFIEVLLNTLKYRNQEIKESYEKQEEFNEEVIQRTTIEDFLTYLSAQIVGIKKVLKNSSIFDDIFDLYCNNSTKENSKINLFFGSLFVKLFDLNPTYEIVKRLSYFDQSIIHNQDEINLIFYKNFKNLTQILGIEEITDICEILSNHLKIKTHNCTDLNFSSFDSNRCIIWFEFGKKLKGIQLITQKTFSKYENEEIHLHSSQIKLEMIFYKFNISTKDVKDVIEFDDHFIVYTSDRKIFIDKNGNSGFSQFIHFNPEFFQVNLDNLKWINIDKFNINLILKKLSEATNLFTKNDYTYHNFYYSYYHDKHFIRITHRKNQDVYLIHICDDQLNCYDLKNQKEIFFLQSDHILDVLLSNIQQRIEKTDEKFQIEVFDEAKNLFQLHIEENKIYLSNFPEFNTIKPLPSPFFNYGIGFSLINSEKPLEQKVILKSDFFIDHHDEKTKLSGSNIFRFQYDGESIKAEDLESEFFLCYMKGKEDQHSKWDHAYSLYLKINDQDSIKKNLIKISEDFLPKLLKYKESRNEQIDFFVYLGIILMKSAQLNFTNYIDLVEYYFIQSTIPEIYKLEIDDGNKKSLYAKDVLQNLSFVYKKNLFFPRSKIDHTDLNDLFFDVDFSLSEIFKVFSENDQAKINSLTLSLLLSQPSNSFFLIISLCFITNPSLIQQFKTIGDQKPSEFIKKPTIRNLLLNTINFFKKPSRILSLKDCLFHDSLINLKPINLIPTSESYFSSPYFCLKEDKSSITINLVRNEADILINHLKIVEQTILIRNLVTGIFKSQKTNFQASSWKAFSINELSHLDFLVPFLDHTESLSSRELSILDFSTATVEENIIQLDNTINNLISLKEKELMEFLKGKKAFLCAKTNTSLFFAARNSSFFNSATFNEVLKILLRADKVQVFKRLNLFPFLPHLDDDTITKLSEIIQFQVTDLLLLKIFQRKLKSISLKFSQGMLDLLNLEIENLSFSFNDPNMCLLSLYFEYVSGMDIYISQKHILNTLSQKHETLNQSTFISSYKNIVAQQMMGQGKSSVILPLLAIESAKKDSICVIITCTAQKNLLKESLNFSQKTYFLQEVIDFGITTQTLNNKRLEEILFDIKASINKKSSIFIFAPEEIQILQLELEKALINRQDEKRISLLKEIYIILKTKANALIDEFASVANVCKVTNIPCIEINNNIDTIPLSHINICKNIISFLCNKDNAKKYNIPTNLQIYLNAKQISELQSALIEKTYDDFNRIHSIGSTTIYDFLKSSIISEHSEYQLITLLHDNNKLLKDLYLHHYLIHKLIPKLLKLCGGRNYGRSLLSNEIGKVIPYNGSGVPTNSEFSLPYETLLLHFMISVQQGISTDQIKTVGQYLITKSNLIHSNESIIDSSSEGSFFLKHTGISLSKCNDPAFLETALCKINSDILNGDYDSILEIESITAQKYISLHKNYLTSTPHDLFLQFASVRGFTGTPWNHPTYNVMFQQNLLLDPSLEDQICSTFLNKNYVNGFENFYHKVSSLDPSIFLQEILTKAENKKSIRAFIDCGGVLKDFSNSEVAEKFLNALIVNNPDESNISVIYFDHNKKEEAANTPFAVRWKKKDNSKVKLILSDISAKTLKQNNILDDFYFVIFSEGQIVGTDTVLPPDSVGIISSGIDTFFSNFTQALMRLRKYPSSQNSILLVSDKFYDKDNTIFENKESFLNFLKKNEEKLLANHSFLSYKQQISSELRRILFFILLENNKYDINNYAQNFMQQENFDPIYLASHQSVIENPILELNSFAEDELKRYTSIFELNAQLLAICIGRLKFILSHANSNPYLKSKIETDYLSQEVVVEITQEINQEKIQLVEQDIIQELSKYKSESILNEFAETPINCEKFIPFFSKKDELFTEDSYKIGFLEQILSNENDNEIPSQYNSAFSNLQVTSNAFNLSSLCPANIFHVNRKQISSILVIMKNHRSGCSYIGLTHSESENVIKFLERNPDIQAFIVSQYGVLLRDNTNSVMLYNAQIKEKLECASLEACILNADFDAIVQSKNLLKAWLHPSNPLSKTRYHVLKLIFLIHEQPQMKAFIQNIFENNSDFDSLENLENDIQKKIHEAQEAITLSEKRRILLDFPSKKIHELPENLVSSLSLKTLRQIEDVKALPFNTYSVLRKTQLLHLQDNTQQEELKKYSLTATSRLGFHNFGNTCYFNATIKAFFSVSFFETLIENQLFYTENVLNLIDEASLLKDLKKLYIAYKNNDSNIDGILQNILSSKYLRKMNLHNDYSKKDASEMTRAIYQLMNIHNSEYFSVETEMGRSPVICIPNTFLKDSENFQDLINSSLSSKIFHETPDELTILTLQLPRISEDKAGLLDYKLVNPLDSVSIPIETSNGVFYFNAIPRAIICARIGHFVTVTREEDRWFLHDDESTVIIPLTIAEKYARDSCYLVILEKITS